MTRYSLYANVENPFDVNGGTQQHWTSFRASHDDDARLTASLLLTRWRRDFGGWSNVQLRNDAADYTVPFQVTA